MSSNVTGGDLNDLRLASNALVDLANVYSKHALQMALLPDADEEKYGRTHGWWTYVASELEAALRFTNDRLTDGALGLNSAIIAYGHVDGDNDKSLTDAGKQFLDFVKNPNKGGKDPFHSLFGIHTWTPAPDLDAKPES